jgi:hypothetical protein
MLFNFERFLVRKLHTGSDRERLDLQDEVSLQYYRLQRISSGHIDLAGGDTLTVKSPTDVGTGKATDEKAPLATDMAPAAARTAQFCHSLRKQRPGLLLVPGHARFLVRSF